MRQHKLDDARDRAERAARVASPRDTGTQAAAHALYRSGGYAECAPFGEYRLDPLSVFMEKRLVTR